MKALQYQRISQPPVLTTVEDPEPGPGQVLLEVTAAGACHSDFVVMGMTAQQLRFPLPLTLGHEGVGTVAALGDGASGVQVGESVAVYGPWGCGVCHNCAQGKENYCLRADRDAIFPPGLGAPGAMAEYLLVDDARHLVPLGGLDPVTAAPLTDAGLTPYHAVKLSVPKLVAGTTAVVIGTGGLGHIGIQLLRAMTPARVVALDVAEEKLELARNVGAHEVLLSDTKAADRIRELTDGQGATAVLDFVGVPPTTALAGQSVGIEGDVTLVGIGGGSLPVGFGILPYETTVRSPYWGSRSELEEVLALARRGVLDIHVERFPLDEAPRAYELLHEGKVNGRAVMVP
ncbi:NAD(P)-dependent alcohol dehydrogenase [Streptomyces tubbatahanensis]|uniref:alcohol dehydrogenase n=1 Tax=Streptomyces tubbatahanensis TaxID=2923272 RepID=A0ABY3Y0F6_9ACTN|nr:NAD(P)-dependent alcohol dehydrogenase [Streptomyces tubbatahanensis]UNT00049.1 NAD(P)-dependent alcohol dehydrogenase [Streptomyces tubbatahanensis]